MPETLSLPASVAAACNAPETAVRQGMLALRALILDTAAGDPRIGRIEEALRWGQPSFLTPETRSDSSLGVAPHRAARFALPVQCQTTLIEDFRTAFPGPDRFDGSRAVLFGAAAEIEPERHGWLIQRALTYRLA